MAVVVGLLGFTVFEAIGAWFTWWMVNHLRGAPRPAPRAVITLILLLQLTPLPLWAVTVTLALAGVADGPRAILGYAAGAMWIGGGILWWIVDGLAWQRY